MKRCLTILSMLSVTGCVNVDGSLDAYCIASEAAVAEHARALADDASEAAVRTGDLVIRQRDAACKAAG